MLLFAAVLSSRAADFGLSISNSPTVGTISNNMTFTLRVTNLANFQIPTISITNIFPASFQLVPGSGFTNLGGGRSGFVTNLSSFDDGEVATITFQVMPTTFGTFTNTFIVSTPGSTAVDTLLATNVVQVSAGNADLGIGITVPSTNVFPGDIAQYRLVLTNLGPGAASSFFVTNSLPSGLGLVGVSPTTGVLTNTPGRVVINVPGLNASTSLVYSVSVRPTNTGSLALLAEITAPGIDDTNTVNNTANGVLNVTTPDTNQLAVTVLDQELDRQTGLFRQTVSLVNTSAASLASARLIVGGLASSNKLYNAVGTNFGNPFVVYPAPINTNQTVNFVLEFYYPSRIPQTNLTYTAYGAPLPNRNTSTNGSPLMLTITNVPNGRVLVEFASTPGKTYRIVYSDNLSFTNPMLAEPPVVAPADRTQWIDEGPPKTISLPGDSGSRFYKVFEQ